VTRSGRDECLDGAGLGIDECGAHLVADFVRRATDRRADPDNQPRRRHAQRRDRRLEHARGQAAPAGMRDRHRTAVVGTEQHRQAVGREHRKHDAGLRRHGRIGFGFRVDRRRLRFVHRNAVHLAQPARWRGQACMQHQRVAIRRDRVRLVAAARAEIETIERCE
jgi:hypothetical protein